MKRGDVFSDVVPFQSVTLKLDAIQDKLELNIPGHTLRMRADDPNIVVVGRFNPDDNAFNMRDGFGWKHGPFRRLFLSWAAQPGKILELFIAGNPSESDPDKFDLFATSDAQFVEVTNTPANAIPVDIVAQTLAQLNVQQVDKDIEAMPDAPSAFAAGASTTGFTNIYQNTGADTVRLRYVTFFNNGSTAFVRILDASGDVKVTMTAPTNMWGHLLQPYLLAVGGKIQARIGSTGVTLVGGWLEGV